MEVGGNVTGKAIFKKEQIPLSKGVEENCGISEGVSEIL